MILLEKEITKLTYDEVITYVEKMVHKQEEVFVSFVEKIENVNALSFLQRNEPFFKNHHFFWKDADKDLYLSGLGYVKKFQIKETEDRFLFVKDVWQNLLPSVLIINPYQTEKAVGPVLFGGFSFLPIKKDIKRWDKFQNGLFYIPKYMLTKNENGCYLTTNIFLDQKEKFNKEQMLRERQTILANARKNIIENEWHEKPVIDEKDTDLWKMRVAEAVRLLKEKVAEKVVLAREIQLDFKNKIHPVAVLQRLSEQQKGSYLFSLKFDEDCFIGATPERLVRKEGMELFSAGVAGSSPRGKTAIEDEQIKQALLRDRKNLDEHQFVVDMILDAFSQVTEFIDKAESPTILTIKDIHHLYTPIKGIIQEDVSIFDVVKLLHPTPALGGTPKDTALQLIPELELFDRGLYAAPIGWVDYQMDGEFVVGIRSALLKEKQALLFAGCGIVRESDPEEEFLETCVKLRPMLRALGGTEDE